MSDRRGWIKLHRQLATHDLWLAERFTRGQAWVDLIMSAAHVEHQVIRGGRALTVPRGAVLSSQVAMAQRWGWTRKSVAKFLALLVDLDMIGGISAVRGRDIGYTLLTVKNYARFQADTRDAEDISGDISGGISDSRRGAFKTHSEEWKERTTKNGKKGRAGARSPFRPDVPSGNHSRKHVDAAWGRKP